MVDNIEKERYAPEMFDFRYEASQDIMKPLPGFRSNMPLRPTVAGRAILGKERQP